MSDHKGASFFGRVALLLLTVYALAMIVPDVIRVVRPLGSFGLAMDGDGRIYDVQGPFENEQDSPAWHAGLRAGDRLDLAAMRCAPVDTDLCASLLSQWGGVTYVTAGREATFLVAPSPKHALEEVKLTAEPRPTNRLLDLVIVLDTIAGVLVVLGAAWLVWTRPGLMTWGFFIYVIQFNPGQAFQFWAWLQLWPRALLAQNVIFLVMQAAAYTGLLLFALRAPVDRAEGRWRTIERALPALAIVFLGVALASIATIFGYPAEIWARGMFFIGFAVSVAALAILIGRRRDLSPRDYQRIRWVIWGCAIGLPAYLLAQLSQETSLFAHSSEKVRRRGKRPACFPSSTGSCACSSSKRCGGKQWSTSGSRFAARQPSGFCSACRSSSSTSRSKRSTITSTCRTGPGSWSLLVSST